MRIGKLRHRIQIQERTLSQDGYGDALPTWTTVARRWAEVLPEAGGETWQAEQQRPYVSGQIRIRAWPGLTTKHRIILYGRTLNVESVTDVEEFGTEMLIRYKEQT